jgi:hypothetical protein
MPSSPEEFEIEIFRAGQHTASNGVTLSYSGQELNQILDSYNVDQHEAPVVVGHPKDNGPAFGWVKGLRVQGDKLIAKLHECNSDFVDLVRDKAYKKVSASFYTPQSPSNPTPGKWALRHVGFLGAMPPAIKGLAGVEFADGDESLEFELDFGDGYWLANLSGTAMLYQKLREWLISEQGTEAADRILPFEGLGILQAEKQMLLDKIDAMSASRPSEACPCMKTGTKHPEIEIEVGEEDDEEEETMPNEMDMGQMQSRMAALDAREKAVAAAEAKLKEKDLTQYCEIDLKGKLTPALASIPEVVAFMQQLDGEVVEFGESKTSPLGWFKGFLARLPQQVEFGEQVPSAPAEIALTNPEYRDGFDRTGLNDHQKIVEYCRKSGKNPGDTTDYAEAMTALGITY